MAGTGRAGIGAGGGRVRFFFVPPSMSFAVSDVQYLLTFFVLLTVGLVIGQLTAGLREQAQVAVRRETDARTLYELARELSAALTAQQIVEIGVRFLRAAFDADGTFFLVAENGRLTPMASGKRHRSRGQAKAMPSTRCWRNGCSITVSRPARARTRYPAARCCICR
jgi:K+-sensing histidine kinase KdpD